MIRAACFLLLLMSGLLVMPGLARADSSFVPIADETYQVAAHEYRFIPVRVANWPATFICSLAVNHGAPIRVELLSRKELNRFVRGRPYEFLLQMDRRRTAQFHQAVPEKGDYEILLINDGDETSEVKLAAAVQFAREPDVASYVSPARRLTVILTSLLVFFATVTWSAFKLVRAMKRS